MYKIWAVAKREYRAAVKSKAFVISIVMMPILMVVSGGIQWWFTKMQMEKEKLYVIIDRSPGGKLAPQLQTSIEAYNQLGIDAKTKKRKTPLYKFEIVEPTPLSDPDAVMKQRFEICQRIETGKVMGLIEIGQDIYRPNIPGISNLFQQKGHSNTGFFPGILAQVFNKSSSSSKSANSDDVSEGLSDNNNFLNLGNAEKVPDNEAIRFQIKNPMESTFGFIIEKLVTDLVTQERLRQTNVSSWQIALSRFPIVLKSKNLTIWNSDTQKYEETSKSRQIVNFILPGLLIALMFMVIMIGASSAMQGVIEEKTLRIAEVLLGSLSPFELMAGKLLGMIGVSWTMAIVYLGGGLVLTKSLDLLPSISPMLGVWFVILLTMSLLVYGSLFIAIGAAAGDIKESQTLMTPIMMLAVLPLMASSTVMAEPNGIIAKILSFYPFSSPMFLVAREAVPPGVPIWEMLLGIFVMILTTIAAIWAAGRVFRITILMQGNPPKFKDLIRWIFKG